jgi:prepilin-type N-terminal cleavage/methylation domain-containing protein
MKSNIGKSSRKPHQGFTLIELAVVVAVIGVLIAIVAPTMLSGKESATAKQLLQTAQDASSHLMLLANAANMPPNTSFHTSGKSTTEVLFGGKTNVNSSYQAAWDSAGLKVITGTNDTTCTSGRYRVAGYCVQVEATSNSTNDFFVITSFTTVPSKVIAAIVGSLSSTATLSNTGSVEDNTVRVDYNTTNNSVSIRRQI